MQTFLPLGSGRNSAIVLDNKRLNKQILEGWQILMVLTELDPEGNHRTPKGWVNHPAVKMWKGYEWKLVSYLEDMIDEWIARGFKTTLKAKISNTVEKAVSLNKMRASTIAYLKQPPWMIDEDYFERVCSTHRQALLAKNYEHYKQFNWPEDTGTAPKSWDYLWPSEREPHVV